MIATELTTDEAALLRGLIRSKKLELEHYADNDRGLFPTQARNSEMMIERLDALKEKLGL